MHDLTRASNKALVAVAARAATAATTGSTIDLANAAGCMVVANVGAIGFATTTDGANNLQMALQHGSATNSFEYVPSAQVLGAITNGFTSGAFARVNNSSQTGVYSAAYLGTNRYVRVVVTSIGTHSSTTPHSAVAVIGPMKKQVAD